MARFTLFASQLGLVFLPSLRPYRVSKQIFSEPQKRFDNSLAFSVALAGFR